jgi:hypothetical protein
MLFPLQFPLLWLSGFHLFRIGQKQSVVSFIMDRNGNVFHNALSVLFFGSKAERKKAINLIVQFKIEIIMNPLLTIVIPTYNRYEYLYYCLLSLIEFMT